MDFLPLCKQDMIARGWEQCDFVYVIGDAYVDHPSFGHAIISRVLESHGYTVGIISQPNWKDPKSIDIFGKPRLGFLVSGGEINTERTAITLMDEFRSSKIGRITLERYSKEELPDA